MGFGNSKRENEKPKKEKIAEVQNNKNDGYYFDRDNKYEKKIMIFELEIFFNNKRQQAEIDKLTRCKKHKKLDQIEEASSNVTSEEITLEQCFHSFMTAEVLSKDNAWYCKKCKDHVEAKK